MNAAMWVLIAVFIVFLILQERRLYLDKQTVKALSNGKASSGLELVVAKLTQIKEELEHFFSQAMEDLKTSHMHLNARDMEIAQLKQECRELINKNVKIQNEFTWYVELNKEVCPSLHLEVEERIAQQKAEAAKATQAQYPDHEAESYYATQFEGGNVLEVRYELRARANAPG